MNRSEQVLCDYVEQHPEERRFWVEKVQAVAAREADEHRAAAVLAEELWHYFKERSGVLPAFADLVGSGGLGPTSMRNLAEYWLRLWIEPRPKRRASSQPYA